MKKVESIVKSIIPNSWKPGVSLLRHLLFSRDAKNLHKIKFLKNKKNVIVLGNGPSLANDMEKIVNLSNEYDFVCVNNFCTSSYYEVIKPNKYIFLDDYFIADSVHSDWVKQRELTFNAINKKTSWPMQIFLPARANDHILKKIIKNKNVEIIKMQVLGCDDSNTKRAIRRFRTGFFGPYQGNVLIYAIYLSIWTRYKSIKIFGADLSFHKDIEVDQNNNHVQFRFRHFNAEDHVERLNKDALKLEPFTMSEFMKITTHTFRAHELLNSYAMDNNVEITNSSSFSFIDAYVRN